MAKIIYETTGDFHSICHFIKDEIIYTSSSASLEDEEYTYCQNVRIGVLVFER